MQKKIKKNIKKEGSDSEAPYICNEYAFSAVQKPKTPVLE